METVVIVASRTETPLREVASAVAVMDEADIQARGQQSLSDLLRVMPGVAVTNSGGIGKTTSLRVRGEDGYRTLVRVDGVDISDPTAPQTSTQVQHLMSPNVQRVELLRGPQGMMYGADAGGVLNISTRQAEPGWQAGLAAEGGRYNSELYSAHGGVAGELGDTHWSIARVRTGGFNTHVEDPTQDEDGYKNTTWHGRQGLNITPSLRLEGVLRDSRAESEYDRCTRVDDCIGFFRQRNQRLSVTHQNDGGQNTFAYSKTRVNRQNLEGGAITFDTFGTIARLELNGNFAPLEQTRFVYGLEHRKDEVRNNQRRQMGAYLEYQQSVLERWYFTAGLRGDDNEDFGSNTTYRISAAQLLPDVAGGTLKFKSAFGTGFRAPSLGELDYNRSQNSLEAREDLPPLPDLGPEQSWGADVGVEYFGANNLHLEAVLFEQHITDEIYFLWDAGGYLQGDRRSQTRGLELIGSAMVTPQIQLNSNYTLVRAQADSGAPRNRQPRHLANVGIHVEPNEQWSFSAQVRAAHRIMDRGTRLDDYRVVSASLRYRANQYLQGYVRGENLLDADYQEVPGYNTSGRAIYAGIEIQL